MLYIFLCFFCNITFNIYIKEIESLILEKLFKKVDYENGWLGGKGEIIERHYNICPLTIWY